MEKYISGWLQKGFDKASITLVAEYCFNKSIRSLEGMNKCVVKFYSQGCVSVEAINEQLASMMQRDMQIKKIIELTGFSRNVNSSDRDMYKVWTEQWNFDDAMIEYGASVCQGKQLFALNNLLAKWKNSNVYTIDEAKSNAFNSSVATAQPTQSYSKEQLSEFFYSLDDLDDIE